MCYDILLFSASIKFILSIFLDVTGKVESINVVTSSAIILYEGLRREALSEQGESGPLKTITGMWL